MCVFAAVVALLAYAAFQKTTVTLELNTTIKNDPQAVFELFKNPLDLSRYHPYFAAVEVKERVEKGSVSGNDLTEEYLLRIREEIPPILFGISLTSTIDAKYTLSSTPKPERFVISIDSKSSILGFVMESNIVWTIALTTDGETLFSEVFHLYPPKILEGVVEEAARVAHKIVLNNIKDIAEAKSKPK